MTRVTTAVAALLLIAMGIAQPAVAREEWRKLHRPLDLPRLAAGEACPVSPIDESVDWESARIFNGSGTGPGPVYPGLGGTGGELAANGTRLFGGRPWFGSKVFWYVSPGYRGRALIRGRRLDGPGSVRFHGGGYARPRELRIKRTTTVQWAGQPRHSRGIPSFVYVRPSSGCHAVQIDGKRFSRTVVFSATTP